MLHGLGDCTPEQHCGCRKGEEATLSVHEHEHEHEHEHRDVHYVTSVAPRLTVPTQLGRLVGHAFGLFVVGWLVMLLLPYAFGPAFAWGYWRVLAAIYVVRLVIGPKWPLLPQREEVR